MEKADVIILDPPRSGCQKELLDAAIGLEPEKIIYVSCDPATMARDIKHMSEKGYELAEATPVDMFPWTASAEVVGLLVKN
jgi:23S rRNA (uracil1939-C5)-methyltransferase